MADTYSTREIEKMYGTRTVDVKQRRDTTTSPSRRVDVFFTALVALITAAATVFVACGLLALGITVVRMALNT